MNTVEKTALVLHRDAIVQNVDFVYIKDKLIAYKVIDLEDLETIECEVSYHIFNFTEISFIILFMFGRKQILPKFVNSWTCYR